MKKAAGRKATAKAKPLALRPEDHPAQWSEPVLDAIVDVLVDLGEVDFEALDPYCGVGLGRLHDKLAKFFDEDGGLTGVELEREWAKRRAGMPVGCQIVKGDATNLPAGWSDHFGFVITSPCYGNRMADCHEPTARDYCRTCDGKRKVKGQPCKNCRGTGMSDRRTYRHRLGRMPSTNSSAVLQWGNEYRRHHRAAIDEWTRVLVPGGCAIVNMSNHFRTLERGAGPIEQKVVEWWVNELVVRGWSLVEVRRVKTQRARKGQNGESRVDGEVLIVARTPNPRTLA